MVWVFLELCRRVVCVAKPFFWAPDFKKPGWPKSAKRQTCRRPLNVQSPSSSLSSRSRSAGVSAARWTGPLVPQRPLVESEKLSIRLHWQADSALLFNGRQRALVAGRGAEVLHNVTSQVRWMGNVEQCINYLASSRHRLI